MKVYDISQEVFSCVVFPGDPKPEKKIMLKISDGAVCNLLALSMCAHNGTHVDAPYHFIDSGKRIDEVPLEKFVGLCYVADFSGEVSAEAAQALIDKAAGINEEAAKRILIKGDSTVTEEAAEVFAGRGIYLIGNESQTVGPEAAPARVHHILLGAEVVLLEGIRLADVPEGVYLLNAAPINLGGADGAPCRAVLIKLED